MKFCTFRSTYGATPGVVVGDQVMDLGAVAARAANGLPETLLGWIRQGDRALATIAELCDGARALDWSPLDRADLITPIPDLPRSVLCVAANYRDHVMEAVAAAAARGQVIDPTPYLESDPSYFTKDPRSTCGPYDVITIDPSYSTMVDWEVELAVVIGGDALDVAPDDALAHVFGYATFNDVSVRDVQRERVQMWKGKNLRGSSPFGPFIVTRDEFSTADVRLRCWVDGDLMQDGTTGEMIHDIPSLVSDLSRGFPLQPGDVIATGTTVGTGHSQNPPRFLVAGDVLETEVEGLGRQRNLIA